MNMIKNTNIYGLNESIKASKYPMSVDVDKLNYEITPKVVSLANAKSGTGHDNFIKGILVQFDLTMTCKMSVELERYHFIDFVSSQSTMHRITKFDLDTAYIEYVDQRVIEIMKEKVSKYQMYEELRNKYPKNSEDYNSISAIMKQLYLEILYTNPCGFQLTARMTTNYQQLKTMYHQRKGHKLPEWREFCKWCETLPYFKEFCCGGTVQNNEEN
jgi:Fe2+ transport system protein B